MGAGCRRPVLVLLAVLGLAASCNKPQVQFDRTGLERKMEAQIEAVMARPAADAAMNAFLEALAADPAVQAAGTAMLESLSADPKIAEGVGQLMEGIQTLPAMETAVRDLMAQHPGASPDEIGNLVGTQLSSTMKSRELEAVFNQLGNTMVRGVDFSPVANAFASRLERAISRDDEARWSKRLIDLNGGSEPSPARATELYVDHVWSVARIEQAMTALLANPAVRREAAKLLAAALSQKEVTDPLRTSVDQLVHDPTVRTQALELVSRCLAQPRDDKAIAAAAKSLLLSKPVLDPLRRTLDALIKSSEVRRRASAMLDALATDRAVRAVLETLMNDW